MFAIHYIMAVALLRLPEVMRLTGRGRTAVYNGVRNGSFPAPVKLGDRAIAWPSDEIEKWIRARIEESRSGRVKRVFPGAIKQSTQTENQL